MVAQNLSDVKPFATIGVQKAMLLFVQGSSMQRFGEKLRVLRLRRGLSYRELAAMLEVTHGHLVGIEANRHKPSADLILKIADIFGVTADQLMRDELAIDE